MAKFLLIDQSLRSVGGHPCDYALHLLQAVERQGYTPILATHRKFRRLEHLPAQWEVLPCFRHSSYSRYALCSSGTGLPPVGLGTADATPGTAETSGASSWGAITRRWHRWRRQAQLRHFVEACEQVFARIPLEAGDHVFFPTASEFDFLALANFFPQFPAAKNARWHLQFHFGIYEGRPAEHTRQQHRLAWVRDYFREALRGANGIDLRFYNTSLPLLAQYQQLGLADFQALPYPINPAIQPRVVGLKDESPRPLRVTCGGGLRQEKGHNQLAAALSDIWEECFASGKMQLQVQAKRSKWNGLRFPQVGSAQTSDQDAAPTPVTLIPHPLGMEDYIELIRQSHVGLLMYNSRRYYARRAGVLCEYLCAGVPVIVPAGCWLSEQIAEAGFEYLDSLCSHGPSSSQPLVPSRDADAIDTPPGSTSTMVEVPEGMGEVILSFAGRRPTGSYLRIELDQFDAAGQRSARFAHVIGQRAVERPARAMWRIDPQASQVRITVQDAFERAPVNCEQVQLHWLPCGTRRPLGSVGLIAADEQHFGRLLREIGEHYPHYRQSALRFSEAWRREHDPMLTATYLSGKSVGAAKQLGQAA